MDIDQMKQRYGTIGLWRFAFGWVLVLSVVALFVPGWVIVGIIGIIVSIVVILLANQARGVLERSIIEHEMFFTPEGQQAMRDEIRRRLEQGDY